MKKIKCYLSIALAVLFLVPLQATFAALFVVSVANFTFNPDDIPNVRIGDTVRWVWESGTHTTTSTTIPAGAAGWNHSITSASTSFDYIPTVSGSYSYKCTPHAAMGMLGSFTVLNSTGISAPAALSSVVLYPNPFVDKVSVRIESSGSFECDLTIRDITGKVVREMPLEVAPGITLKTIDLENLRQGVYFLELLTPKGEAIVRKMIRET